MISKANNYIEVLYYAVESSSEIREFAACLCVRMPRPLDRLCASERLRRLHGESATAERAELHLKVKWNEFQGTYELLR